MSLRVRLMVLSSVWLVFILVLFNTFLYWFVVNITTKSEKELMLGKARTILENRKVVEPQNWKSPKLLEEYLTSDEMIRIVGMDGKVKLQLLYDGNEVARKPPIVIDRPYFAIKRIDRIRFLYVDVPILTKNGQVGVLEIGRELHRWNDYMDVLTSALVVTSVGAVVLSAIGSFFYSRFMFQPIRQLYTTMQLIQQSGTFRKLDGEFTAKADELGKLGVTFNEMIERLEELAAKQKRFVADASHELRTPLTIIESYASILKRWGLDDSELREEAVESILSETNRLKGLVGSLMQLADSERAESLKPEGIDLVKLIRSAAKHMEVGFHRDVAVESPADSVPMTGDPQKLRQLLLILLDNAIKYSSKPVTIRIKPEPESVRFEVVDRGVGLGENEKRHVFDRFYRVDQARTRQTGGFGLGLSIAKSIVNRHGGTIDIRSRPGVGTIVSVTLPIDELPAPT
ncbi:sensor histidine kinase [Paenibacillus flagellatus]|uniref:histidine kinase n=1 Tax=Paenibacillus flagellatus TaxID=2211139 RepID=A0A2V5K627_9BACL|nr:ATP-binding protein [Paenibacillus flagellatus]PYI54825.1 sensor histidine kinase [Paenibacillus flagellatus]